LLQIQNNGWENGEQRILEFHHIIKFECVGYAGVTRGRCSSACFGLATKIWISSQLLMVRPGPLVDQAMWIAAGVVLQRFLEASGGSLEAGGFVFFFAVW
jgi:hypothetical protein